MLQHSPTYFRYTKNRVLSFWGTPLYLLLKSTNEKHNYFQLSNFRFFLLNFYCKYETSTANIYAECFQGLSKLQKNYVEKIKGTPSYLNCNSIAQNLQFFYFLCSSLELLRLLIDQMHHLPKNML